jgi:hypothetical protein
MEYVVENLYKEIKKSEKKEDNLRDNFRRRLAYKKKPHHFIVRWWMLRKSNKNVYDFLKKIGKILENGDKEPSNFASWS